MSAGRQSDVAPRGTLGVRSERGLRERAGETPGRSVGKRRSRGPARGSAAVGRRSQAGRVAQAGRGVAGHGRLPGIQDREAAPQTRSGHRTAGSGFCPRNRSPKRSCCTCTNAGKRPTRPGGPIEQLVRAGQTVLAVDLRGTGQTQAAVQSGGYSDENSRMRTWHSCSLALTWE